MIPAVMLTFAAVFLTILAIFLGVSAARHTPAAELKRRLQRLAETDREGVPAEARTELLRETSAAERFIFKLPLLGNLQRLVVQSGLRMKESTFLLITLAGSLSGFIFMAIIKRNLLLALVMAIIIAALLLLFLHYKRTQRERKFTEQLPDALTMIARSLRAGHSLTSSIELVGQELAEPAGELFSIAYEQQKLGIRITDAIAMLIDKMESVDLRFFVTIININYEVGGNLAEILEKLADTIRSRLQIRRQVRVYTAQGRLSGYILALLPVGMFVMLYFMLPGYVDIFIKDPRGQFILAGAACTELAGFFVIRKIIDIRI